MELLGEYESELSDALREVNRCAGEAELAGEPGLQLHLRLVDHCLESKPGCVPLGEMSLPGMHSGISRENHMKS